MPRPRAISDEEWEENYRRIFGRTTPQRDREKRARKIGQLELFDHDAADLAEMRRVLAESDERIPFGQVKANLGL